MEVLRRPIHPEPGNASMAAAARLATLFSLGQSNGMPWPTDYSALTYIQGNSLQIPWRTKAEAQPNKPSVPMPQDPKGKKGVGTDEGQDTLTSTEGDDISLTGELGNAMQDGQTLTETTPLTLTMTVYAFDPRTPTLVSGAKNSVNCDVGDTLKMFDADRKKNGAEFALRGLLARPCAAFVQSVDAQINHIKGKLMDAAEIEAKLEALPGVIG